MAERGAPVAVTLTVNGTTIEVEVEPRTLLVHALRDGARLPGTKVGCDTSQCGACTVLVDGLAMKSCTLLAVRIDGAEITTIEGLAAPDGTLDPVQAAFCEHHGLQCGFCTPGMIMAAADLIRHNPDPTEVEIRRAISGNLCRCTGYQPIFDSIRAAAERVRKVTA